MNALNLLRKWSRSRFETKESSLQFLGIFHGTIYKKPSRLVDVKYCFSNVNNSLQISNINLKHYYNFDDSDSLFKVSCTKIINFKIRKFLEQNF